MGLVTSIPVVQDVRIGFRRAVSELVHDVGVRAHDFMMKVPRGSIYTTYGIRPPKNHPYFGFGDLIP